MLDQAELDMYCTTLQESGSVSLKDPTVAEVRQITDTLGISDADARIRASAWGYVTLETGTASDR